MQRDSGAILRAKSENFYFSLLSTGWPVWKLVATVNYAKRCLIIFYLSHYSY